MSYVETKSSTPLQYACQYVIESKGKGHFLDRIEIETIAEILTALDGDQMKFVALFQQSFNLQENSKVSVLSVCSKILRKIKKQ